MAYHSNIRTITAKFAGKCYCCGAVIKAGELVDYHPRLKKIAHIGGLEGNGPRCYSELKRRQDPGFVDLDRMYEDQCADICGR